MDIFIKLSPAKPTAAYATYWKFAAERQNIFFKRLRGEPPPWTTDPILSRHKFTNAYRASDRVSQYLIRNVIYKGDLSPEEVFFRCILFKIFNRESTWELFKNRLGEIRVPTFSVERFGKVLEQAKARGDRIFSAAYIMPSRGKQFRSSQKHENYLRLLKMMLADQVPAKLTEAKSMAEAYNLLLSYPLIGKFLAYQFVTDINYSAVTNFSEKEFVVPGPGALDGIRKCFSSLGDVTEEYVIQAMAEKQHEEFQRLGFVFQSLWGRDLQWIDCQNLFCEVSKYSRAAHPEIKGISDRTRIKQIFTASSQPIHYWFPPKWGLNHLIEQPRQSLKHGRQGEFLMT